MQQKNMQQFIRELESAGELHRISAKVDPKLEITEIVDRISKAGGPALLFENVSGSEFPVLINAFGSYRRMQMALSCGSFDEIGMRLEEKMKIQPPRSLREKVQALLALKEISDIIPKKVKRAPCQERVYGPDGDCSRSLDDQNGQIEPQFDQVSLGGRKEAGQWRQLQLHGSHHPP